MTDCSTATPSAGATGDKRPGFTTSRATTAATIPGIVAVMPMFLLGATGVLVRADLGFDQAALGLSVSVFFLASSVVSVFAGRLVERIGAGYGLRLVCVGSGTTLMAISLLARDLPTLIGLLIAGGAVNGLSQPSSNLALAREVTANQGLMFGVKQAAVPVSTLIAGASVPIIALQWGWRWAFALTAVAAWMAIFAVPVRLGSSAYAPTSGRVERADTPAGPMVWLAIAAAFGTAGATAMASFLVESAAATGIPVARAGWLLVAGSAAGVCARLLAGAFADRTRRSSLHVVAVMLGIGSIGYLLLSLGDPRFVLLGAVLAYAFGWGWTGLLMYAIVRLSPRNPAAASGIVGTGAAAGAALGPLAFGYVVTYSSFGTAWRLATVSGLVSAALVLISWTRVLRSRSQDPSDATQKMATK